MMVWGISAKCSIFFSRSSLYVVDFLRSVSLFFFFNFDAQAFHFALKRPGKMEERRGREGGMQAGGNHHHHVISLLS